VALVEAKEAAITELHGQLRKLRVGDVTAEKYLRRPEVAWADLAAILFPLQEADPEVAQQVEYDIKYAGYIARQDVEIARQQRLAGKTIPDSLDYAAIKQLRIEAREKLSRVRPTSLAQASRISGITPADVALLMTHLKISPHKSS
jgi:tRNA uridine 5-carboxymethylaminomethyl modification enzyme